MAIEKNVQLSLCPCCGGSAAFKRFQPLPGVFAVHVSCGECGLRTDALSTRERPPEECWEGYELLAQRWNRRVRPSATIKLPEPDAWQQFDGEGGMEFCRYFDNEQLRLTFRANNPAPMYKDWVEPLFTSKTVSTEVVKQLSHLVDVTLIDEGDNQLG